VDTSQKSNADPKTPAPAKAAIAPTSAGTEKASTAAASNTSARPSLRLARLSRCGPVLPSVATRSLRHRLCNSQCGKSACFEVDILSGAA
jgi:hypothetical protein